MVLGCGLQSAGTSRDMEVGELSECFQARRRSGVLRGLRVRQDWDSRNV